MQDLHTHTTYSDGADSLDTMVTAAVRVGITELGITDHVRAGTTWLPAYVDDLRRARATTPIRLRFGIEAKLLDTAGNLDMPDDLDGIEYVAIADHRVPTPQGPRHPHHIRRQLAAKDLRPTDVIEMVTTATVHAAASAPVQPVIAHLFSILPKVGLAEQDLPLSLVARFATQLAITGAWVEINEKWRCPGAPVVAMLAAAGVPIVAGSDSHSAAGLGRFRYVRRTGTGLILVPMGRAA